MEAAREIREHAVDGSNKKEFMVRASCLRHSGLRVAAVGDLVGGLIAVCVERRERIEPAWRWTSAAI